MVSKKLVEEKYISVLFDDGEHISSAVNALDVRSAFNAMLLGETVTFGDFHSEGNDVLRYAGAWFIALEDDGSLLAWVSLEKEQEVDATLLVASFLGVEVELVVNSGASMYRDVIAGPLTVAAYRATLTTTVAP